jgi:hypothetical protein
MVDSEARGGRSSAGRAPGCGPGGRGFESHRSPSRIPANRQFSGTRGIRLAASVHQLSINFLAPLRTRGWAAAESAFSGASRADTSPASVFESGVRCPGAVAVGRQRPLSAIRLGLPGWGPGGRRFKFCLPDATKAPQTRGFCRFRRSPETRHGVQTGSKFFGNLSRGRRRRRAGVVRRARGQARRRSGSGVGAAGVTTVLLAPSSRSQASTADSRKRRYRPRRMCGIRPARAWAQTQSVLMPSRSAISSAVRSRSTAGSS